MRASAAAAAACPSAERLRVPSHLANRVTPGRSVPVRAVMVGGGWVIAYQWDLE